MLRYLDKLYRQPPEDSVQQVIRKVSRLLNPVEEVPIYNLAEVLNSVKHMRAQRPYDYLHRYEKIVGNNMPREPFDFDQKRVLEIGVGPVLGWGPLAVYCGATEYVCVDPEYNDGIFKEEKFINFLRSQHRDFSALFGKKAEFEPWVASLKSKIKVHRDIILDAPLGGSFDIVLSNSTLEHVHDLEESLNYLHSFLAPQARFLHCVDFGSHRSGENPFNTIYTRTPEQYFEEMGTLINLKRPSDMLKAFAASGAPAQMVPYYSYREFFQGPMLPYWTERYDEDELFIKCAIFVEQQVSH